MNFAEGKGPKTIKRIWPLGQFITLQMPRQPIIDAHEWINEISAVPGCIPAKPQTRERSCEPQRGKKTLLSLTPICGCAVS